MSEPIPHPASFRDPSGFVFRLEGIHYRQVNRVYAEDYELLMHSGLYRKLTEKGLLITHTEIGECLTGSPEGYKTLLPQQIATISYSCEWAPAQLKDAALLTLDILDIAMGHGMILKDATPLNTQFRDGRPLFIDTLSFEKYDAAKPWVAYRQFCECFLFPLYLHHYLGTGIGPWLRGYPEGVPAALTASLLPWRSRLNAEAPGCMSICKAGYRRIAMRVNAEAGTIQSERSVQAVGTEKVSLPRAAEKKRLVRRAAKDDRLSAKRS